LIAAAHPGGPELAQFDGGRQGSVTVGEIAYAVQCAQ